MTEQARTQQPDLLPLSLKNEIKGSIESTGTFKKDFSGQDLTTIVNPMIKGLLQSSSEDLKGISFGGSEIAIANNKCSVLAKVKKGVEIKLGFDLGNSPIDGQLQVIKNSEGEYFTVSAGLATGVVKGELNKRSNNGLPSARENINQALANPNKSLLEVFRGEVKDIEGLKAQVRGGVLSLELTGKKKDMEETPKKIEESKVPAEATQSKVKETEKPKPQQTEGKEELTKKSESQPTESKPKEPEVSAKPTEEKEKPLPSPDESLSEDLKKAQEQLSEAIKNSSDRGGLIMAIDKMERITNEIKFQTNPENSKLLEIEDGALRSLTILASTSKSDPKYNELFGMAWERSSRNYSDFLKKQLEPINLTREEDKVIQPLYYEIYKATQDLAALRSATKMKEIFEVYKKIGRYVQSLVASREKPNIQLPPEYGL